MRERPILFSGPMVRALLEGRKTQTRRIIKPGKWLDLAKGVVEVNGKWVWHTLEYDLTTPFGEPGDRLWVRETWAQLTGNGVRTVYRADGDPMTSGGTEPVLGMKWRPSIHMPRWASRLTLEITGVRVERVQDITANDCVAEGIASRGLDRDGPCIASALMYIEDYADLWRTINGPESWDANPWVWVLEFKVVTP